MAVLYSKLTCAIKISQLEHILIQFNIYIKAMKGGI